MTDPSHTKRKPFTFPADDPSVTIDDVVLDAHEPQGPQTNDTGVQKPSDPIASLKQRIGWGGVLVSAMAGLALLAASLSFTSFVAHVVSRDDWIGWLGFGLAALAGLALAILAIREFLGLVRLGRLRRLRSAIDKAFRDRDLGQERRVTQQLMALYGRRDDLKWSVSRLKDHIGDVRDPGHILQLAERELMTPLDARARALILKSAKRVTVITAISPMVWIAMVFVIAENLRLIRFLAALYGARPGSVGALRLARMVFTHILATGGLAMTDDLLGQFLGQDLVRRLSRRLGEGVFNGALTARIGTAAATVVRPLPYIEREPLRLRDIVRELVRGSLKSPPKAA